MKMTEQQFKRWMISKTRQYIWLIIKKDPNRFNISFMDHFERSFKRCHGACSKVDKQVYYRTDYIKNGWDCNMDVLEKLVIHEVCHLAYPQHDSNFFTIYKYWSGDDFIDRWHNSMVDSKDGRVSHVVGLPDLMPEELLHGSKI